MQIAINTKVKSMINGYKSMGNRGGGADVRHIEAELID